MSATISLDDFQSEGSDLLTTEFDLSIADFDELDAPLRRWWEGGATPSQAFRNIKDLMVDAALKVHLFEY